MKLSLVTCSVAMIPATSEQSAVRFHTLNRATGNRVEGRYVDAITGKLVSDGQQVKGYERGPDDYIMLEDAELEAVALETTRTIDIEMFVPNASIESIWYDQPYYLFPNDKVGAEAFTVIREAMKKSVRSGLSRLVLYRREHAVMLQPRGKGIILWTLRFPDEIRDSGNYFSTILEPALAPGLLTMAGRVADDRLQPWSSSLLEDPTRDRLLAMIAAKNKGKPRPKKKPMAADIDDDKIVDITEALRRSLGRK